MSSAIIFDPNGLADTSFNGIPLRTLKKVMYSTKLGTMYNLLKMIVNGVTYNFEETAQNGAVIFNDDYSGWVFIAPDGRLNFEAYPGMLVGEVFDDMEAILSEKPIPSWDAFVNWLNSFLGESGLPITSISRVTIVPASGNGEVSEVGVDLPSFAATNCVEFLENLESAFSSMLDLPASYFKSSTGGFAFTLCVYGLTSEGKETEGINMAFTFRE